MIFSSAIGVGGSEDPFGRCFLSGGGVRRTMMKSKIHRATVTGANLHYVGSISLDPRLMAMAGIVEWEKVAVLDVDNGARFETYAIVGSPGELTLNGAAARLVQLGDRVSITAFGSYDDGELDEFRPVIVHVDDRNWPVPHPSGPLAVGKIR